MGTVSLADAGTIVHRNGGPVVSTPVLGSDSTWTRESANARYT